MPTPESEAFLAKKPTVPPTFDGVDYDDHKRLKQAQDAIIREQWVHVMMGRLVREEMSKCYYREGVNHLEKCGHLRGWCCHRALRGVRARNHLKGGNADLFSLATCAERYLQLLKDHRIRGFLFEQQNYVSKK